MPTLYATSTIAPGITPTIVDSGWTRTSAGIVRKAAALVDTSSATTFSDSVQSSVHSSCLGQFIYGPLAAQTISGTLAATVWGATGSFGNIYESAIAAWIATSTGSLRGTLLSKRNDPNHANWQTFYGGYSISGQSMSSVACSANDYLILEAGLNDPTFTNAEIGYLRAGGSYTQFTLSNAIQLYNPASLPSVVWLGRPQPKRS